VFYGREEQLAAAAVDRGGSLPFSGGLGIGGIGKSTLAVKLGLQIREFEVVVVWPQCTTVEELLESVLHPDASAGRRPTGTHWSRSKII